MNIERTLCPIGHVYVVKKPSRDGSLAGVFHFPWGTVKYHGNFENFLATGAYVFSAEFPGVSDRVDVLLVR